MSKELSPLEALNDLREVKGWNDDEFNKRLDIIETALKKHELLKNTKIIVADKKITDDDLEKLKCESMIVGNSQCEIKPLFDEETLNKLKALEIIKEKQVNVGAFYVFDNLEQYNGYCEMVGGCKKLTQEEFDLLKEVLK